MNEVMESSLAQRRFSAELVAVFAVMAVMLASVGIYGLLAYLVGQRSQEIGGICTGPIMAAVTAP